MEISMHSIFASENLFSRLFSFFYDNFPSVQLIKWFLPLGIIYSFIALYFSGWLKIQLNWKTGYSRKLLHFFIFIAAYFTQLVFGLAGVFILGWSVTAVLIYAVFKGDNNLLYEAIARESDAPHRTRYIVYSYSATFVGGVLSNLFFGYYAIVGYAITGIADALAEPIGVRFGKHKYKVFSLNHQDAFRTFEGSLSVFITTFIICSLLLNDSSIRSLSIVQLFVVSISCTAVEALSPRGFDNALIQLTVAGLFYWMNVC